MIESKELAINKDIIYQTAEYLYRKTVGMEKCDKQYDKLRRDSERVLKIIEDRADPKAVYSYYDKVTFSGRHIAIGDETFYCPAFEQIDPHTVKGAYIYFVTAGDFHLNDEPIMDQLLADIWGTSFTDAARVYLKKILLSETLLSDNFGPGFYGMDVRAMNKLAALTDCELIGVTVTDSSVILPVKACGGMYFSVNGNYVKLDRECEDCKGNSTSCSLCNIKKKEYK